MKFDGADVLKRVRRQRRGPGHARRRLKAGRPRVDQKHALIVTAPALAVRYGPASYFGSFHILHAGEGVSLIGRSGNSVWLLVQLANGSTGWVATGYVSTAFPIDQLPARG